MKSVNASMIYVGNRQLNRRDLTPGIAFPNGAVAVECDGNKTYRHDISGRVFGSWSRGCIDYAGTITFLEEDEC